MRKGHVTVFDLIECKLKLVGNHSPTMIVIDISFIHVLNISLKADPFVLMLHRVLHTYMVMSDGRIVMQSANRNVGAV